MKRVLKNIFFVALLSTVVLAPCCDDEEEDSIVVANPESLIQSVYADATEGESSIKFTATGAWSSSITEEIYLEGYEFKSANPDWVSISPEQESQEKAHIVSIRLKPNYLGIDRWAIITISCGKATIKITIEQKGTVKGGETLGKVVPFLVYSCNMNWTPSWPPEELGVIVPIEHGPYTPVENATVTIYDGDEIVRIGQTGVGGEILIANMPPKFSYTVTLGNERNTTIEGYIIAGVFISQGEIDSSAQPNAKLGDLKFVDLNGDGRIDGQDVVANGRANVVVGDGVMRNVVFIAPYETE